MTGTERSILIFFLAAALGSLAVLALPPLPGDGHVYVAALWIGCIVTAGAWQVCRAVMADWHLLQARLGWLHERLGWRPARAPERYVRDLFDTYAHRFDTHLLVELAYAAPNHLRDLVDASGDPAPVGLVVDLGCGTGVLAPLFRPLARELRGVDLSPEMLRRAEARGLYDRLIEADIIRHLEGQKATCDLLIAADVLVYLGDLRPLMAAVARALRPGGRFAFTTEHLDRGDFVLCRSGRYAHGPAYVAATARAAGLAVEIERRAAVRVEADRPVEGGLYLLRRPAV